MNPVMVIGVGADGPSSLDATARAILMQAELVYGGQRVLSRFPDLSAEVFPISANLPALADRLRANMDRKQVVLASGDPNFFGIAEFLYRELGREQVEVYPGVSSVQLAFARLRMSWHDAVFRSVHGRPLDDVVAWVRRYAKLVVLTDPTNHPGRVAQCILDAGMTDIEMYVLENLGTADERIRKGLPSAIAAGDYADLSLMVVLHSGVPPVDDRWGFGIEDNVFAPDGPSGFLTKKEVRAVSLALLGCCPGDVVWDIGAGSGSVAIEAAGLVGHFGQVYAIERNPAMASAIRAVADRLGRSVHVVVHEAPEGLSGLERPDRVFIGGSGGRLADILEWLHHNPPRLGRVVINLVGLEHVGAVLQWSRAHGWRATVSSVTVARSVDTKGITRMAGLNPVFIVQLDREGPD